MKGELRSLQARVVREGVVVAPSGNAYDEAGVLNPAALRTQHTDLLLYARVVAAGNVSRIARYARDREDSAFRYDGFALEPSAPYELRDCVDGFGPGHGCEDPRITYIAALGMYVMAYTAFGNLGPRIALATSRDGRGWDRLGLMEFSSTGVSYFDDKDAAFFPEPVRSPAGVLSLALYHRPMHPLSKQLGWSALGEFQRLQPSERDATRIAYVPLDALERDLRAILVPQESVRVLEPVGSWGTIKNGAGTPPLRTPLGWFSLFHAVDMSGGDAPHAVYRAGIVIHDLDQPHIVRYRSPEPIFAPIFALERSGTVDDVVFPTAMLPRSDGGFDVYYGMADTRVGALALYLENSSEAPET